MRSHRECQAVRRASVSPGMEYGASLKEIELIVHCDAYGFAGVWDAIGRSSNHSYVISYTALVTHDHKLISWPVHRIRRSSACWATASSPSSSLRSSPLSCITSGSDYRSAWRPGGGVCGVRLVSTTPLAFDSHNADSISFDWRSRPDRQPR